MGNQRFSITPAKALADQDISHAVYRTLAALGVYGDKNGWCWPSLSTLGNMLGKSPQAISKDIKVLEEAGYITVLRRYDKTTKENLVNKYQIRFDYPYYQHDNTLSTPEVDTLSTPEVEVTPQFNAYEKEDANAFTVYTNEIGLLTDHIGERLGDMIDEYTEQWTKDAILIASENNARNLTYIETILSNWKNKGRDWKPGNRHNSSTSTDTTVWVEEHR